jgi:type I restriction-modification system DNA methylase subunit
MAFSLNKPKFDNLAGDIWKSAERLRGKFKAYEYQNVVLPIIVIRRLECVPLKWRQDIDPHSERQRRQEVQGADGGSANRALD